MSEAIEKSADVFSEIKCKECGANLKFQPGTTRLTCEYCGAANDIVVVNEPVHEIDYLQFISEAELSTEKLKVSTVKCENCGASTTLSPNVTSDICPYCSTPLVIKNGSTCEIIRPKYLLPFKVDRKESSGLFSKWVNSLWFAPNDLKSYVENSNLRLKGVYMPFWTFDSQTNSLYDGARGTYYYVTESYTTTVNGKAVTRTRQVRRTSWTSVSGQVSNSFDDLLVFSSHSLPANMVNELEPWDLNSLVNYDDKFLSGFVTESYQIDVKESFNIAKSRMDSVIQSSVRRDIGGDEQRIYSIHTDYLDITFKHILLPLWISAYKYNNKTFRFIVNARTGEVKGERPYSAWKITFFVLGVLVGLAGLLYAVTLK